MYMYARDCVMYVQHYTRQQDSKPTEPGSGGRPTTDDFDNCKQLDPSLSLAWTVNRSSESVQFMLCGCIASETSQ